MGLELRTEAWAADNSLHHARTGFLVEAVKVDTLAQEEHAKREEAVRQWVSPAAWQIPGMQGIGDRWGMKVGRVSEAEDEMIQPRI